MNNQREWFPVFGYEELYEINKLGKIKSMRSKNQEKLMRTSVDRCGYEKTSLSKDGICNTVYIHRLMGLTFLPLIRNKPYINHKDGNKLNNTLDNLEWVSPKENATHAYSNKLMKHPSKSNRTVLDSESGVVYDSIFALAKALGRSYTSLKKTVYKDKRFLLLN